MSLVLVVRMRLKSGAEARAQELLRELATETRKEPGCEAYVPAVAPDDPQSLIIFEQYVDRVAQEAHGASEHFKRLGDELWGLLEAPRERTFFETII
jgi:quinol monooxygenase YgiN